MSAFEREFTGSRPLIEAAMNPLAPMLADQQRAFDAFRRVYNEERPPASRYAPSPNTPTPPHVIPAKAGTYPIDVIPA